MGPLIYIFWFITRVFAGFYALLVTISTVVDVLSTWMVKNNLFDSASTSTNADVLRYAHKTSSEETPLLGSPATDIAQVNPKSGTSFCTLHTLTVTFWGRGDFFISVFVITDTSICFALDYDCCMAVFK